MCFTAFLISSSMPPQNNGIRQGRLPTVCRPQLQPQYTQYSPRLSISPFFRSDEYHHGPIRETLDIMFWDITFMVLFSATKFLMYPFSANKEEIRNLNVLSYSHRACSHGPGRSGPARIPYLYNLSIMRLKPSRDSVPLNLNDLFHFSACNVPNCR